MLGAARTKSLATVLTLILTSATSSAGRGDPAPFAYPAAPRGSTVDHYFGHAVADPYRWLEDASSAQTQAFVRAQNALTRRYLDGIGQRAAIGRALAGLKNVATSEAPVLGGEFAFSLERRPGASHAVLVEKRDDGSEPVVLVDPARAAPNASIGFVTPSADGRYVAYAVHANGSDWQSWHVVETATHRDLGDDVPWSKYVDATWDGDAGFYYGGYDAPANPDSVTASAGLERIKYHRLGQNPASDRVVFTARSENEYLNFRSAARGSLLFLNAGHGGISNVFWKRRNASDATFEPLVSPKPDASYVVVGAAGDVAYVLTDDAAPNARIVAIHLRSGKPDMRDVVPEAPDALEDVVLAGDTFVVSYLHDAHSVVKRYDLQGRLLGDVALPAIGSVTLSPKSADDRAIYYSFESYLSPKTIFRYDLTAASSFTYDRPNVAFDAAPFVTEQRIAIGADGTRVPVFVTHRRDMTFDGTQPTLMYGYGGFDLAERPFFSPAVALWLEMGGVFADVVVRGGGEFGEAWHDGGRRLEKQHTFDDWIAAAQSLVDAHITSPSKLAAMGDSNGGLSVAAIAVERPDLFAAVLPNVGLYDMLRFQKFSVGAAYVNEYGSSSESEQSFKALLAYSPYHNVRRGTAYPAMLIYTADHDDRSSPVHSYKFAAALQDAQRAPKPILLEVESQAGHGQNDSSASSTDTYADRWSFLVRALDFTPTLP